MKGILLCFLIFQLAGGNLIGAELAKMPFLFSHYRSYAAQQNDEASWLNFLKLHYGKNKHRQSDESHNQLPLQQSASLIAEEMDISEYPAPFSACAPAPTSGRIHDHTKPLRPSDYKARLLRPPIRTFVSSLRTAICA